MAAPSIFTTVEANAPFCRGDNRTCDCEKFRPKKEDEGHCLECGHDISKHPDADTVAAMMQLPLEPPPSTCHPSTEESAAWETFKGITGAISIADTDNSSVRLLRRRHCQHSCLLSNLGIRHWPKNLFSPHERFAHLYLFLL
jgi:hypothetical protein